MTTVKIESYGIYPGNDQIRATQLLDVFPTPHPSRLGSFASRIPEYPPRTQEVDRNPKSRLKRPAILVPGHWPILVRLPISPVHDVPSRLPFATTRSTLAANLQRGSRRSLSSPVAQRDPYSGPPTKTTQSVALAYHSAQNPRMLRSSRRYLPRRFLRESFWRA